MKRVWGHLIAVGGITAGAVGMVSACAHDDSTIFIRNAIQPPVSQGAGMCLYTKDPSQPVINSGVLDVAFSSTYAPTFLIGNQMTPRGNPQSTQTETSRVELQGAIVRITDVNGSQLRDPFTRTAAGFVDPATGGDPGYAPYTVLILDSSVTGSIRSAGAAAMAGGQASPPTRILAYVKVFGHTLGGTRVETNEYQFPIDVCYGCLVNFPAGVSSMLPGEKQPNCANASTMSGGSTVSSAPCVLGQDQQIDCRLCVDTNKDVCGGGTAVVQPDGGTPDTGPGDAGDAGPG